MEKKPQKEVARAVKFHICVQPIIAFRWMTFYNLTQLISRKSTHVQGDYKEAESDEKSSRLF